MRNVFNQFINRPSVIVIISCMIVFITLAACKRADEEVTIDLLESKLVTEDPEAWLGPLTLEVHTTGETAVIIFYDDNTFKYIGGSVSVGGTWNFDYAANRSGQYLTLNMAYTYLSVYHYQSFELKYSAEQDIFYSVDHNDQSLEPWGTTIYIP